MVTQNFVCPQSDLAECLFVYSVSQDEDENSEPTAKSKPCSGRRRRRSLSVCSAPIVLCLPLEQAADSIRSDSFDSTLATDDDQKYSSIKCDSCQELFATSEQFNQHRLYRCSFLTGHFGVIDREINLLYLFLEETGSDESRTSSFDDYTQQIDTVVRVELG